ncbi:methyl-accepting chemotaxis protein [Phenylobacterium sp.]|uniref:methyl-accepting chemotaxis protein n=1 Tax=Phenylobacterium sp. TaxID=1871053 RepID=UPI003782E295
MSIANRILLGFAAAMGLMVLVGLFGLQQIAEVRNTTTTIVTRDIAVVRQMGVVRQVANEMRAASDTVLTGYLTNAGTRTDSDAAVAAWRSKSAELDAAFTAARQAAREYSESSVSAERAAGWRRIEAELTRTTEASRQGRAATETLFTGVRTGDQAMVAQAQQQLAQRRLEFNRGIETVDAALDELIQAGRIRADEVYTTARNMTIGGLIVAVIVAAGVAYAVRNSIVGPLNGFMAFVQRVGRGDLAGQPASTGKDELGQLGVTLNEMVEGLKSIARQSREATENLNAATAEIRASTQEQAAGVEEQLAAVQETAATVDEITHSGAQISKRAQEVIASAQATAQTSTDGLRAVDETTRAMDAIREQAEAVAENIVALSEKTQAIGDIIATVNDISERSHLLALNAAIEAAAAGENGRSFSVVASEMKMLADQAKDATSQVRSILGDIQRGINASVMLTEEAVKRVAAGKERTDTTQRTITEITGRVQESVQTFQQIVASTNQQQLGIEQVMSALQNIRQASQQTAAGTRQLDDAAGNLTRLSQQLLSVADRYRT